jgi:hypothetical protein
MSAAERGNSVRRTMHNRRSPRPSPCFTATGAAPIDRRTAPSKNGFAPSSLVCASSGPRSDIGATNRPVRRRSDRVVNHQTAAA